MKAQETGRMAIKNVNSIVNFIILTVIVFLIAFAGYALWDSAQIYNAADKSNYTAFKPTASAEEGKSFEELQIINPDVIAWLSVYGTNIDYPVTQGADNIKYINTDAEGNYSLSGAIFLDYRNRRDFRDFNSILYGHHMEKNAMFGEIGGFVDRNKFDSHLYGNLYYENKDYGIEFFAFIQTDAYDSSTFKPNIKQENRQEYLDDLLAKALHQRDINVSASDRLILLSTCSLDSTNGRDILVGRITDTVFDDPYKTNDTNRHPLFNFIKSIPWWVLALLFALFMTLLIYLKKRKRSLTSANPTLFHPF